MLLIEEKNKTLSIELTSLTQSIFLIIAKKEQKWHYQNSTSKSIYIL